MKNIIVKTKFLLINGKENPIEEFVFKVEGKKINNQWLDLNKFEKLDINLKNESNENLYLVFKKSFCFNLTKHSNVNLTNFS